MYRHLTSCRDRLLVQLQHSRPLPRITDLHAILKHLTAEEKQYLRNIFANTDWNVGSTIVLAQLQLARILTMTDYIWLHFDHARSHNATLVDSFTLVDSEEVDKQTSESVQLILNDLLETEFVLLADLAKNIKMGDAVGLKMFEVLRECFARLIGDLAANPAMAQVNCVQELRTHLTPNQMSEVLSMIWGVFEEMESGSILEAIEKQTRWNEQFAHQSSSSLLAIMREIALDEVAFVDRLLALLRSADTFTGWHCWLHFWRVLMLNQRLPDKVFATIRQHLKETFRLYQQSTSSSSDTLFHAMMLCARQTCHFAGERQFENYTKWYKNTIGEMQYGQTKDAFRRTMQTLSRMIRHETDLDVLEVHVKTAISAPAFCGDLVLSFKQVSKSWMQDLKEGRRRDDDEIMVVD